MKTCSRALRISDWDNGSLSNSTMTLSTQPRQHRIGVRTNLWMSLSGPARTRTWTRSNISGETWKYLYSDAPHPTWQSVICREEWEKLSKYRCAKLVVSYPRRLESVIAAKGASTKYWVNILNTYVIVIFQFVLFFVFFSKKLLWHWGVVCVDWWGGKLI